MSLRLKPYPEYKDSGVPWLGEVPEHWEVRRLKREAKINPSKLEATAALAVNVGVTFLPMERVGTEGQVDTCEVRPASSVWNGLTYFRRGDVLVAKITPCFENGKGACLEALPTDVGFGSTEFIVLRPMAGLLPQFLYRITTLPQFRTLGADVMTGAAGQQRVPQSFIADFLAPLPPLPEQTAIVRFLDHADRLIRRYIRAKRRLIELLSEQKQAIIQRAVTRGLDPNVRLKPSGVEWLDDFPEHWEVVRVKNEFRCLNHRRVPLSGTERGAMTSRQYDYYGASGIIDKVDQFLFDDELLLIAEDGANLVLRNLPLAIIARGKFWVNNHAHILKPKRGNLEYLASVMESLSYLPWISGAAQPKLTQDRLMRIAIAVPPPEEQNQIIASVATETGSLRSAIDRTNREIALLREFRTRLFADVVTGKLDVRGVKLPQLEEAEELAPLGKEIADDATEAEDELEPVEESADAD